MKKEETRKLREIVEIVNVNPDGIAITNTPFTWNPNNDKFYFVKGSKVFEKITKRYGIKMEDLELEFRRKVQVMYRLYLRGIFKFTDMQEIVNRYYKKPAQVLKQLGIE
jgi:hypothetical protein